jgi:hypothetical protein
MFKFDRAAIVPITTGVIGRQLYDHRADDVLAAPGAGEIAVDVKVILTPPCIFR